MIEFFYDCASPWTYLGFDSILGLSSELDAPVSWRPILVGAVFNAVNPSVYERRENPVDAKRRYMLKDLHDWARHQDIRIHFPPSIFPINSAKAMRACIAADHAGKAVPFSRLVFEAYWRDDRDIASDDVLADAASASALDQHALIEAVHSDAVRAELRANTDELIERGGFGSPTLFVDGTDMFFGNDRMPLVRNAIVVTRSTY